MAGLDDIELLAAVHTGANRLVDAARPGTRCSTSPDSSTVGVVGRGLPWIVQAINPGVVCAQRGPLLTGERARVTRRSTPE